MAPEFKALQDIGIKFDDVLAKLDTNVGPRHAGSWIVRWRGRLKVIDGSAIFSSRQGAINSLTTWLRRTLRDAMWAQTHRPVYSPGERPPNLLSGSWASTKAFRAYSDQLLEHLISIGRIEIVEIEPSIIREVHDQRAIIA